MRVRAKCQVTTSTEGVQGYLDIAMQQLSRVHIFEGPEDLIHDILLVNFLQNVGPDHGVQVGLHILKYQIDVTVVFCL